MKLETSNRNSKCRGFTLVELAVALSIIGVLAAVLLDRLGYYREMAEKAAMEATVRLVKTGLQIRLAELIVANRQSQAPELLSRDPLEWLERKPANYYGGAWHSEGNPGTWYFDEQARQLVYVVNAGSRLEIDGNGLKTLRFQAKLLKDRVLLAGNPVERVSGVTVAAVHPYRWR